MDKVKNSTKPLLRGYIHQESFYFFLGAGSLLIANCGDTRSMIAIGIYVFGLAFMLGTSAFYHRPHWEPKKRSLLKRADHCAIFVLIASTATPIAVFGLDQDSSFQFLAIMWVSAVLGIFQSIFWVKAPKYVTAIFYVGMGWSSAPFITELKQSLGSTTLNFIVFGGVVYSIGAIFYAMRRPKLFPRVFGYHELFHVFTVIGAGLHFIAIYKMI